jgi:pseudouridine kinase
MNTKITIIGGINLDILASAYPSFKHQDSNPGTHTMDAGGVGYNLAYNLRLLGYDVSFFTVIGDDDIGKKLKKACIDHHIQVYSPSSPQSCVYVSIFDHVGDMQAAIASMDAIQLLTPQWIHAYENVLQASDVIICDANISIEVLTYVSQLQHPFKIIELVSQEKALKLIYQKQGFHWIKGNEKEINILYKDAIQPSLLKHQTIIMTNQESNATQVTSQEKCVYAFKKETHIVNSSGAGDAFLVGCLDGYLNQKDILKQGHFMALCALKNKSSTMLKECVDEHKNK